MSKLFEVETKRKKKKRDVASWNLTSNFIKKSLFSRITKRSTFPYFRWQAFSPEKWYVHREIFDAKVALSVLDTRNFPWAFYVVDYFLVLVVNNKETLILEISTCLSPLPYRSSHTILSILKNYQACEQLPSPLFPDRIRITLPIVAPSETAFVRFYEDQRSESFQSCATIYLLFA